MRPTFFDIGLYKIGIITIVVSWAMDQSGYVPLFSPHIVIGNMDAGFYILHIAIYLLLWAAIYFLERLYGAPSWFVAMRSRQGTARWLDWMLLLACVICGFQGLVARTISPYFICLFLAALVAAVYSLHRGREQGTRATTQGL